MIEDFVAAVREEREPVCHAEAGLHTQEVIAAAYQASRERKAVEL
jgi:predicted dehydrogenase